MVKKVLALALGAAVAVSIVGCTKPATNDGEVDTASWQDMQLRVAGYRKFNDDPLNYEFASGAEKFAEEFKTKPVEFIVGGGDGMGDDLVASIVAGDPWDLQYSFGVVVFPTALAKGVFTPITKYLDVNDPDLDKITLEGAKWKDEYYGISNLMMQEFSYSAYNETWFKELGIKTPHERYAEGTWTEDGFMEMVAEIKQKGQEFNVNKHRINVLGRYMTKWNDDGTAEIIYDSPENEKWLSMWEKFAYDPAYKSFEGISTVSAREVMYIDEVFPNVLKNEVAASKVNEDDVIRYIQFPQLGNKAGTYLNDSDFLVPSGVKEEKIPAAVKLATYMCKERAALIDDTYKKNMSEEDYKLLIENLENAYYIPRFVTPTLWQEMLNQKWIPDSTSGKPVSTHIQENLSWLKSLADEFNNSYAKGEAPELTAPPATQAAQ